MNARTVLRILPLVLFAVALLPPQGRPDDVREAVLLPVRGQPLRVWQDDSGYHRVRGQLVAIGPDAVRLLKENQRVTTVPMTRLSQADREHVNSIQVVLKPSLPSSSPPRPLTEAPRGALATDSARKHVVASITISRSLLNRFMQDVDRSQPLTTTILGVPIRGWVRTVASADLLLVPSASRAVFEIPVRGQVTSTTVGDAVVAQIHTQSLTDFEKRVRVNLSEAGVSVEPLELSTTNRFINSSVSATSRAWSGLVARVANRRMQASKPAADQIARQQERQRIDRAFAAVAAESVGKLNRMLREFLPTAGDSQRLRDSRLGFSTTATALHVALATVDPPLALPEPPVAPQDAPLVVQVHASVVLQAAQSGMATDVTEKLQQLATGEAALLRTIRAEMQTGKFSNQWSDDEAWLTITWRADADTAGR